MRKVLLSVLSAAALSAAFGATASVALAAEGAVTVSAGTTAYTASQTSSGHTFTMVGGRVWSCSNVSFTGAVTHGSKSFTAAPGYSGCAAKVGGNTLPMTVATTGCDFVVSDMTPAAAGTWAAKTDIACPAGQAIHIIVYSSEANHTSGTRLCEYTWGPQSLTGVHVTDSGSGNLTTTATGVAIATTRTFGSIANCGEASFNTLLTGSTVMTPSSGSIFVD